MPKCPISFFPLKWGILASVTRFSLERDQMDVEMPKCPIFGHVLVTDAKMPHFKGKNEMGHFGIGMHIHASDISLSQPFWGILATLVYSK